MSDMMMGQARGKPTWGQQDQFQGPFSAFLQDELSANYNLPVKPRAQWPVMTQH